MCVIIIAGAVITLSRTWGSVAIIAIPHRCQWPLLNLKARTSFLPSNWQLATGFAKCVAVSVASASVVSAVSVRVSVNVTSLRLTAFEHLRV